MKGFICQYKGTLLILSAVICLVLLLPTFKQGGLYLNRDICYIDYIDIIVPNAIIGKIIV